MRNYERIITRVRDVTCLVVGATGILFIVFTTDDPSKVNEFLLSLLGLMMGAPTVLGAVSLVRNSSANGGSRTQETPSQSTAQLPPSSSSSS